MLALREHTHTLRIITTRPDPVFPTDRVLYVEEEKKCNFNNTMVRTYGALSQQMVLILITIIIITVTRFSVDDSIECFRRNVRQEREERKYKK